MGKTKPLTNIEIKQAKPRDKVDKLSDCKGLQLRVKPNGNKSWLLVYMQPHTNGVRLPYVIYPEEIKQQIESNLESVRSK